VALGTGSGVEPGDIGRAVELCEDVSTALAVMLGVVGLGAAMVGALGRGRSQP
jgi:hypothetical protein